MNREAGSPIVHMVGSIPLPDAETVFRTLCGALGDCILRVPDGETGRRARWISFIADQLKEHPDLEVDPDLPPFAFRQWDGKLVYEIERLRLRPGVDPASVTFDTGYADDAIRNYEVFERLRVEGVVPEGVKYQICMATPLAITYNFISANSYGAFLPAYTRHLAGEFGRIAAALPHDRISYQWDVCQEVLMWEGYFDQPTGYRDQILSSLGQVGDLVPPSIDLGFHLCYGSPRDEHMVLPKDLGVVVEIANGIVGAVSRPIAYVHMPVIKNRSDDAYFRPLADLALPDGADLYLGLVHDGDPEGNARKLAAARNYAAVAAVAAECGLGRGDPDALTSTLAAHRALAGGG